MTRTRVALVTGAGRGIGRAIALELARSGFDIAGWDILYEPENARSGLFEVKAGVEAEGRTFLPIRGDVARLEDHPPLLDRVIERFGRIDVLVNNAGVAPEKRRDILETTPESYDRVMAVNSRGAFFLTQRVVRTMMVQKDREPQSQPTIIFITSISAEVSSPSRAEYCISKAALSQTARVFAHRLADLGINVYEVRPGIIQTDMTAPVKEKYDALIQKGLVPQKRWGRPEDVARVVASLARGDFSYATGLIVEVSGGMQIRRL